jgi:hypothetical protein
MNHVRRFWKTMNYGCEHCHFVLVFYLEDGCEGPRDIPIKYKIPSQKDIDWFSEKEVDWFETASGRVVLPVPFIAGLCPKCRVGMLQHVEWSRDVTLIPTTIAVPSEAGQFWYPKDPTEHMACGEPKIPVGTGS